MRKAWWKRLALPLAALGLTACLALPAAASDAHSGFFLLDGARGVSLRAEGERMALDAGNGTGFVSLYEGSNALELQLSGELAPADAQVLIRLVTDGGDTIFIDQHEAGSPFHISQALVDFSALGRRQLMTLYIACESWEEELSLRVGYLNGMEADAYPPGDANRSGALDHEDAQRIADAVARRETADVPLLDADGNGILTARDALAVLVAL